MKKKAEAEQKAEAEKKNKALKALHEPPSVPKGDHPDTGTDESFMAAFTAAMIYHEIHGHHRSGKNGTMTATGMHRTMTATMPILMRNTMTMIFSKACTKETVCLQAVSFLASVCISRPEYDIMINH